MFFLEKKGGHFFPIESLEVDAYSEVHALAIISLLSQVLVSQHSLLCHLFWMAHIFLVWHMSLDGESMRWIFANCLICSILNSSIYWYFPQFVTLYNLSLKVCLKCLKKSYCGCSSSCDHILCTNKYLSEWREWQMNHSIWWHFLDLKLFIV